MSLTARTQLTERDSFPRVSGDEPTSHILNSPRRGFSPRERG